MSIAINTLSSAEDPVVNSWVAQTVLAGGVIAPYTRFAYNNFVRGLKLDGLWVKMSQGLIMPFSSDGWGGAMVPLIAPVGSTFTPILLTSADYNLANGIDPGAANLDPKRIATNINAQSFFQTGNVQVSVYRKISRLGRDSVANTINGADVQQRLQFHATWENASTDIDIFDYDPAIGRLSTAGLVPIGLITGNRINNQLRILKNGVQFATSTGSSSPAPNDTINLIGCFDTGFAFYSRSSSQYIYLGQALTNSEELLHYKRVQELQTALERQV